tara:strand:+ start:584 stop:1339 length:756 start_codon:yes stop_codon:yes gene_type:complete
MIFFKKVIPIFCVFAFYSFNAYASLSANKYSKFQSTLIIHTGDTGRYKENFVRIAPMRTLEEYKADQQTAKAKPSETTGVLVTFLIVALTIFAVMKLSNEENDSTEKNEEGNSDCKKKNIISKKEFLNRVCKTELDKEEFLDDLGEEALERAIEYSYKAKEKMPSIGFLSVKNRMNSFLSVCHYLDKMVELGNLSPNEAQIVLIILRLKEKKFEKAIIMFEIQSRKLSIEARIELPDTATQYLSGMVHIGY